MLGLNKVYNMDNMDGMRTFPDGFFDLAIVDPPYGIGEDGRNNHTRCKLAKAKDYRGNARYDNAIPGKEYFQELFRVSKNQVIWGGNYFIEHLRNTPSMLVWDKDNSGDFADCEIAWTSFNMAVRKFKWRWNGMLQEDMKNKEERIHPNQKPIALYKWILKNYAKPDHKIIDTHGGSLSFAIACIEMGFDFVAFEINEQYYKEGISRVEAYLKQSKMFTPQQNRVIEQKSLF